MALYIIVCGGEDGAHTVSIIGTIWEGRKTAAPSPSLTRRRYMTPIPTLDPTLESLSARTARSWLASTDVHSPVGQICRRGRLGASEAFN